MILPRIGRIAWNIESRPDLAEPPAESPSTMYSSLSRRVGRAAVGQLARQADRVERALAADQLAGLRAAMRARAAEIALVTIVLASAGLRSNQSVEPFVAGPLHERLGLGVAELGLGLALELRLAELDRDDRGQALADVVAGERCRPSP